MFLKSGLTAVKVTGKQAALEDSPPTVRLFGNLEKQDCRTLGVTEAEQGTGKIDRLRVTGRGTGRSIVQWRD